MIKSWESLIKTDNEYEKTNFLADLYPPGYFSESKRNERYLRNLMQDILRDTGGAGLVVSWHMDYLEKAGYDFESEYYHEPSDEDPPWDVGRDLNGR